MSHWDARSRLLLVAAALAAAGGSLYIQRDGVPKLDPAPQAPAWSERGEPLRDAVAMTRLPLSSLPPSTRGLGLGMPAAGLGPPAFPDASDEISAGRLPEEQRIVAQWLQSSRRGGPAIVPPDSSLVAPANRPWSRRGPPLGPDGGRFLAEPSTRQDLSGLQPPPDKLLLGCRSRAAHWHADGSSAALWHDGDFWGMARLGRWVWLERRSGRWWAWPHAESQPLTWEGSRWWSRSGETWTPVQ